MPRAPVPDRPIHPNRTTRRAALAALASIGAAMAGCRGDAGPPTGASLPGTATWIDPSRIAWICTWGADGMWGGVNVWISAAGTAWVERAGYGQVERFHVDLAPGRAQALRTFVATHDFRRARSETSGVTDVAHMAIGVLLRDGTLHVANIVEKTHDADFLAVEAAVGDAARIAPDARPDSKGPYAYDWRPPGWPAETREASAPA